jgi:transposase
MNAKRFRSPLPYCLGLDVSKATLDFCLLNAAGDTLARSQVANDDSGFARLLAVLRRLQIDPARVRVVLEATGVYGQRLVEFLHRVALAVAVINPAQIKYFGVACLRRSKTDRADAFLIARYGLARQPVPERALSEAERVLKALVRERETRARDLAREKNRLEKDQALGLASVPDALRRQRALRLRQCQRQLDALDAALAAHVAAHPELQAKAALLTSIPGVGAVTAAKLLACLAGKVFEHGRQVVAYAGLNPAHHQSGTRRGTTTLSKVGNGFLRKALFMPAAVARRWCPALKAWADGLAARGLTPLQVRAAVMRKLLLAAYAVLKHQTPFDPTKLCLPQHP